MPTNIENSHVQSPEQQKEADFKQKYEAVKRELDQVSKSNDANEKLIDTEVLKKNLDGAFGEKLEKSPQQFKELKEAVKKIKDDPTLQSAAGDGLNILDRFLNAVVLNSDGNRNNSKEYDRFFEGAGVASYGIKEYASFMEKLQSKDSLKKLSNMTVDQINKVKRYLESNPDAALKVYNNMKSYVIDETEETLVRQDKEFFDGVWNTLVLNYGDSDEMFGKVYGEIEPKVDSLKGLLNNFNLGSYVWNGENFSNIPLKKGTIFSRECVVRNFNKLNDARVKVNDEFIKTVDTKAVTSKEDFKTTVNNLWKNNSLQFVTQAEMERFVDNKWKEIESQRSQEKFNTSVKLGEGNLTVEGKDVTVFDQVRKFSQGHEFIEKDGNNYKVYPDKAADYLSSLKSKIDPKELKSRNELKALDSKSGERQTWIAAVQILLNNIPEITKNNPLDIDGTYVPTKKLDDPTFKRVMEFQNFVGFGTMKKGKGFGVDGLPGPNTIKALTDAYKVKVENGKTADDIRGTLEDLKEVGDEQDRKSYGVEGKLYKNRINSADKAIYYRSGNDVYKISTDQPWERQKAKAIDDGKGGIKVEWEVEPYACNAGAEKITEGLKSIGDKKLNVALENGKYRLTSEGGVTIDFDADVKNPVFNKDFCGNTGVDRFKLVALASRVKKNGDGDVKIASVDQSGITTQEISVGGRPTGIFASEMFNYYGLENKNEENIKSFLAYCNNLKLKEGVYSYEKKDSK